VYPQGTQENIVEKFKRRKPLKKISLQEILKKCKRFESF
jgi:hypothetical protein